MRTTAEVLENFSQSKIARSKSLSKEDCRLLIEEYHNCLVKVLLENGYVQLNDYLEICIVKLKKRVHVLRGQSYTNHRNFKLKARMGTYLHKKICDSFDDISLGV